MSYYFYTTANSESKDFFSVFLDHEFDLNLHKVDRKLIRKPPGANGLTVLLFSLKNNSSLLKRHTNHHFCVQMFEFQHFRRSVGIKRSKCETFLGHGDVLCGPDILLPVSLHAHWIIDHLFFNKYIP